MRIDQTRIKAFWANPERFRLAYECNVVPAVTGYALQRGLVFHVVLDLRALGWEWSTVTDVLHGRAVGSDGRLLHITNPQALAAGLAMAEAYLSRPADYTILRTELEFDFPIDGSPHSGVGRLDQLVQEADGRYWLLEFKTGSPKTQLTGKYGKKDEWEQDKQADFEILGARSHGYEVEGLRVQYVLETTPPKVWEPLYVTRTEAQLQRTKLMVHQTCELIQMSRETFGIEQPWVHCSGFPCNSDASYCDHKLICGREGPITAELLGAGWTQREEHLALLRDANG